MRNTIKIILSLFVLILSAKAFADSTNVRPKRMLSFDIALSHLTNALFNQIAENSEQARTPILFVDNRKEESGDGSFTNPFNNFVQVEELSQEGDIIYVFPTDTTKGLDQGITLKDRQWLIGLDTLSSAPTITKAEGDVVRLANDNTVMGFKIITHSGWGIYGELIHDAALCNNEIICDATSLGAISLYNTSGIIDVEGNAITSLSPLMPYGVRIENSGTWTAHIKLYGNVIENFETGIFTLTSDNTTTYSSITHNMIEQCNTQCIHSKTCDAAFHSTNISSNRLNISAGYGCNIASSSLQPLQVQLQENQIHDCATGVFLSTHAGGQLIADVKYNIFLHNKELGFLAQTSTTGFESLSLNLRNNANTSSYVLSNGNVGSTLKIDSKATNIGEIILQGKVLTESLNP